MRHKHPPESPFGIELSINSDKGIFYQADCETMRVSAKYGGGDYNRGPWTKDDWVTLFFTATADGGWLAIQIHAIREDEQ